MNKKLSRECIKFRVWCKDKNEWEKDPCLLSEKGSIFHYGLHGCIELKPDNHIVSFYVGIKDKQGKEIYAGDIIKTEHGATGVVVWDRPEAGFKFDCNEPRWSHPIHGMDGEKEIIGNIYEYPNI